MDSLSPHFPSLLEKFSTNPSNSKIIEWANGCPEIQAVVIPFHTRNDTELILSFKFWIPQIKDSRLQTIQNGAKIIRHVCIHINVCIRWQHTHTLTLAPFFIRTWKIVAAWLKNNMIYERSNLLTCTIHRMPLHLSPHFCKAGPRYTKPIHLYNEHLESAKMKSFYKGLIFELLVKEQ